MPADSRTGIESRIVLRPVCEVKETAAEKGPSVYGKAEVQAEVKETREVSEAQP
jgi:hypothetical protein